MIPATRYDRLPAVSQRSRDGRLELSPRLAQADQDPSARLEVAGILLWLPNHAVLVDRFGSSEDFAPHVFVVPGYAPWGR